jgi:hypothetical protein
LLAAIALPVVEVFAVRALPLMADFHGKGSAGIRHDGSKSNRNEHFRHGKILAFFLRNANLKK